MNDTGRRNEPDIRFHLRRLSPVLRTLLLSDGTVTKFLEAYFAEAIQIKLILHEECKLEADIPALEAGKGDRVLRRRATFRGAETGTIYCHAESHIRADLLWPAAREELMAGKVGIGELLRARRIETYRELLTCEMMAAGEFGPDLGLQREDAVVTRSYRIFVQRAPCIFIVDKFPANLG